jgi:hypothetical protein
MKANPPKHIAYDLGDIAERLFKTFPAAIDLYLFGSRRFRTGSERSDIGGKDMQRNANDFVVVR